MSAEGRDTWSLYRRVLAQARPYRLHIGGILALSLLSTPLALLTPLPIKVAVDSVLGSEPLPGFLDAALPGALTGSEGALLLAMAALVVVLALLTQVQGLGSSLLRTYTGQRLVRDFRARLFRHSQRLSLAYHDRRGTSDSTYRIQYDAPAAQWIAIDGVIPFASSMVKLVTILVVTLLIDVQLGLVALVIVPLLFVATHVSSRRLRGGWRRVRKLDSSIMSTVSEVLGSVRVVKAFGQEDREQERFVGQATAGVRERLRVQLEESLFGLAIGVIVAAGTATVLYVGVTGVQSGRLTLGTLLLLMSYLSQVYRPLEKMSQKIGDLQASLVSAERAFAILDEAPEVPERPGARPLRRARGEVRFEGVTFAYPGERPVLHDVSLAVPAGARVGVAGPTGAGKTTLVSLLSRFYDPSAGRILLDGADLRDLRLADLREQFAIVLQEPVLFSGSIGENIAYARAGASQQEVVAAARAAGADGFVAALPEGYDTRVGERGMLLSGGERQRISLARAFLKDAPILILDEPTSAVDTSTEARIMEAMAALMRGRTTFLIAHRLGTLDGCDIRVLVEEGRVRVQVGAELAT